MLTILLISLFVLAPMLTVAWRVHENYADVLKVQILVLDTPIYTAGPELTLIIKFHDN